MPVTELYAFNLICEILLAALYGVALKEKIPVGLIPYAQSTLLAKYIRGEIDEYPCFLMK